MALPQAWVLGLLLLLGVVRVTHGNTSTCAFPINNNDLRVWQHLYNFTGGRNWKYCNSTFFYDCPCDCVARKPSGYYDAAPGGVTCDHQGNILEIDFVANNMVGALRNDTDNTEVQFDEMRRLYQMRIERNPNLHGAIPNSLAFVPALSQISLSHNTFAANIKPKRLIKKCLAGEVRLFNPSANKNAHWGCPGIPPYGCSAFGTTSALSFNALYCSQCSSSRIWLVAKLLAQIIALGSLLYVYFTLIKRYRHKMRMLLSTFTIILHHAQTIALLDAYDVELPLPFSETAKYSHYSFADAWLTFGLECFFINDIQWSGEKYMGLSVLLVIGLIFTFTLCGCCVGHMPLSTFKLHEKLSMGLSVRLPSQKETTENDSDILIEENNDISSSRDDVIDRLEFGLTIIMSLTYTSLINRLCFLFRPFMSRLSVSRIPAYILIFGIVTGLMLIWLPWKIFLQIQAFAGYETKSYYLNLGCCGRLKILGKIETTHARLEKRLLYLTRRYVKETPYWQLLIILRQCAIAIWGTFANTLNTFCLVVIPIFILGLSLVLQIRYRPYLYKIQNHLEELLLTSLIIIFGLAPFYDLFCETDGDVLTVRKRVFTVCMMMALVVPMLASLFCFCFQFAKGDSLQKDLKKRRKSILFNWNISGRLKLEDATLASKTMLSDATDIKCCCCMAWCGKKNEYEDENGMTEELLNEYRE